MVEPRPLVSDDERLTHQIVDTFASVGQADPSWTVGVRADPELPGFLDRSRARRPNRSRSGSPASRPRVA